MTDFDPISPNYYQFPNGVEVHEISEWLNSNGGQAVQYIARSTRIDGIGKGDPIENLQKAKEFLDFEITRLELVASLTEDEAEAGPEYTLADAIRYVEGDLNAFPEVEGGWRGFVKPFIAERGA